MRWLPQLVEPLICLHGDFPGLLATVILVPRTVLMAEVSSSGKCEGGIDWRPFPGGLWV